MNEFFQVPFRRPEKRQPTELARKVMRNEEQRSGVGKGGLIVPSATVRAVRAASGSDREIASQFGLKVDYVRRVRTGEIRRNINDGYTGNR